MDLREGALELIEFLLVIRHDTGSDVLAVRLLDAAGCRLGIIKVDLVGLWSWAVQVGHHVVQLLIVPVEDSLQCLQAFGIS